MDNKKITFHTNIKKTATKQPIETTWCVFANDYNSVQVEFVVDDLRPDEIRTVTPTIVLIMDDGSTVQRTKEQIVQKNNVFSYKLKGREGQHTGAVKAQLKLTTVAGETSQSNIYTFTILESLDSVPVPKEFVIDDIQNILQEVKHHITHIFKDEETRKQVFADMIINLTVNEKQRETWFNQSQQTRANLFQVFMDEAQDVLKDAQQVKDLFDELVETGIIETNIREKLGELETSYAPRLSTLEQNDVSLTAQLQQTEQELNAQLAQKANYDAVRLKTHKNELEDMSPTVLAAIEGGEGTTFNLLTVPQDYSVSVNKTDFVKVGKNLFNKHDLLPGKLYAYLTGKLTDSADYFSSKEFIPVSPSTVYSRSVLAVIIFYDENKTFISGATHAAGEFTTPSNAVYIKVSVFRTRVDTLQVEKGESTDYENYHLKVDHLKVELDIGDVDTINIKPKAITKEKLDFTVPEATPTKNLFNKKTAHIGYFINQTTGALAASTLHVASDYIKVTPSEKYSFVSNSSGRIAFYDANKNFISGLLDPALPITMPANCEWVIFSFPTSSINLDTQQFQQGELTEFETFGYTLPGLITDEDKAIINLPPKIYGLTGQELNIYFDNIVSGKDTEYTFDVAGVGIQYENFWRYVPEVAETRSQTISVYKGETLVASATFTLVITDKVVGDGVTKNVIVIGDSTTDNGTTITKLNENFADDVLSVNTIGTRGTAPNQHEGRSGWTAELYTTVAESTSGAGVTVENEFWNPDTTSFDFTYYMSNSFLPVPDYVVINLGINDVFSVSSDDALENRMAAMVGHYNTMINSIKAYNSAIRIGLALTIPPNYSQDAFGKAYRSGQTRARYKRNNILWVNKLIETYQNREAENLYLVPIHTNLDTRYNMGLEETQVNARNTATFTSAIANGGVHPVESGYWQIADVYWYWLKSFES